MRWFATGMRFAMAFNSSKRPLRARSFWKRAGSSQRNNLETKSTGVYAERTVQPGGILLQLSQLLCGNLSGLAAGIILLDLLVKTLGIERLVGVLVQIGQL